MHRQDSLSSKLEYRGTGDLVLHKLEGGIIRSKCTMFPSLGIGRGVCTVRNVLILEHISAARQRGRILLCPGALSGCCLRYLFPGI